MKKLHIAINCRKIHYLYGSYGASLQFYFRLHKSLWMLSYTAVTTIVSFKIRLTSRDEITSSVKSRTWSKNYETSYVQCVEWELHWKPKSVRKCLTFSFRVIGIRLYQTLPNKTLCIIFSRCAHAYFVLWYKESVLPSGWCVYLN